MKRAIGFAVIILFAFVALGVAFRLGVSIAIYDEIVGYSVRTFDIDPSLAKGLAWFGVAFLSLVPAWTLLRPSRRTNFFTFVLVGALAVSGWYVHRDDLFTQEGQAVRYVAITNNGLVLSQHGGVDPKTGAAFQPVTEETAPIVALWLRTGGLPPLQDQLCTPAFSALTGQAICWFEVTPQGIVFSRLPGYSPVDGQRLLPVTHAVIEDWQRRHAFRQKLDGILATPDANGLRVSLYSPPSANRVTATRVADGSDVLSVGTRIGVTIKFHPLSPESIGLDRLTPASIAVHKAIGLWPGQPIFLHLPQEVDGASGKPAIAAGSTAEALLGVNTDTNDGNQLLVSVSVIRLFLPRRRHAIPIAAHLDPSCATPLMNFQFCEIVLDETFPGTVHLTTNSSLGAFTARNP
jgi:hypothetical protein